MLRLMKNDFGEGGREGRVRGSALFSSRAKLLQAGFGPVIGFEPEIHTCPRRGKESSRVGKWHEYCQQIFVRVIAL